MKTISLKYWEFRCVRPGDQVDWHHRSLRLDPGTTKTNEGRTVPMVPELHQALEQWRIVTVGKWPTCPWICHRDGNPIKDHRHAWKAACKRVGLDGRLFHDLRRSAVRNLIRAGVPQVVARKISGHKTDSVFNRYNIVSHTDLSEAVGKLSRYIQERTAKIQVGQSLGKVKMEPKNAESQVIDFMVGAARIELA